MSKSLYRLFIQLYQTAIRIAANWNPKARSWIEGRKGQAVSRPFDVWMHCASLGEFEQGRPLLEALRERYPARSILLSFFSPSGFEIMKNYEGVDAVIYLPIDKDQPVKDFLGTVRPRLVLWMKYEYWLRILEEIKVRQIPLLLVSGIFRADQPFFKWYGTPWRKALQGFHHLFVQDEVSLRLIEGLKLRLEASISGDSRFDRVLQVAARPFELKGIESFCGAGPVIVAGSTWKADIEALATAYHALPQLKWIIAPHEVKRENFEGFLKNWDGITYSEWQSNPFYRGRLLIIDSMGLLSAIYRYANITFVGGGFAGDGVHNVLEPAVYGKPVLFGPVHQKYREAVDLIANGGALCVRDGDELLAAILRLLGDAPYRQSMGDKARAYVESQAGATGKVMNYIIQKRWLE